jgi:2-hydroxychromene-2-carboxylate isomerase
MTGIVEFWFDFSSPYGYFASHRIDAIAETAGRTAVWKPFMLGATFQLTGARPLSTVPLKGSYSLHDWDRLGRYYGVPWTLPDPFPIATLAAARVYYWLAERDAAAAKRFAKACFHAYFGEGQTIEPMDAVAAIAESLGISGDEAAAAARAPEWKAALKTVGEKAVSKGVCGSPFVIVDGEGFWGDDRLVMVAEWLLRGGW